MKMHYENWPEFTALMQKIKEACTIQGKPIAFPIEDSLSNIESFNNIDLPEGDTPEECIERGLKYLAERNPLSSIREFNEAERKLASDDSLRGQLFYYRAIAYSKRGERKKAAQDREKAEALGYNRITIPVYEIRTIGRGVKTGRFIVDAKRKAREGEWRYAHQVVKTADKFFQDYAKIFWYHFQHMDNGAAQEIVEESKQEALSELEENLKGDFSKKGIRDIRKIVSEEWDKPTKSTKNRSPFISAEDKPESERRRAHENISLAKILELYRTHTDIKIKRQIQFNMAFVLDAVNFWPERNPGEGKRSDKYVRRLKEKWIDIEQTALDIKRGHKFIEDQFKVCPSETPYNY